MQNSEEQMWNLTGLERRCLSALIEGKTEYELQEEVQLSGFTVQIIINALLKKLDVRNVSGLIFKVLQNDVAHQ